jgi:hypothetical protein
MNVFWDENVYDESIVKEWLGEVKLAAEWYLLDTTGTQAGSRPLAKL